VSKIDSDKGYFMRILVLNGPNLNLLSQREPGVYGTTSLNELESSLRRKGQDLGVEIETSQSNSEGTLIDMLQRAKNRCAGIVFNPGGYTHTSVAIRDAITAIDIPVIEVHISNIHARESFRQVCITTGACAGQINGMGLLGYHIALQAIVQILKQSGGSRGVNEVKAEDQDRGQRSRRGRRGGRRRRGEEYSETTSKDEPESGRKEALTDPSERYSAIEGVTVRKGLDVLAEEVEGKPREVPRGRVSFGGDESPKTGDKATAETDGRVVRKRTVRRRPDSGHRDGPPMEDGPGGTTADTEEKKTARTPKTAVKSTSGVKKKAVKKKTSTKKAVGVKSATKSIVRKRTTRIKKDEED
jgi:3-dehydroquinate dehydratase-2